MIKTYIFFYKRMDIGGCELLIKKLAKEMYSRSYRAAIYCESISDAIYKDMDGISVVQTGIGKWDSASKLKAFLGGFAEGEINIVSFLWHDYFRLRLTASKHARIIFYAVHYEAIKSVAFCRNSILNRVFRRYAAPIMNRLIKDGCIIAMSERVVQCTADYYKIDVSGLDIIRIPVDLDGEAEKMKDLSIKYDNERKVILAVARADFPFKGYLIGLINMMEKKIIPENFTLQLVAYGPDFNQLAAAYHSCDKGIRERIEIKGKMEYEGLRELFENAHVYVGMGTTLLDASKYGVISIPAAAYTYKVECTDFFYKDYTCLGPDSGSERRFLELLNEIQLLNAKTALPILIKGHDIVRRYYGTEHCADELERAFENVRMENKINTRIRMFYYMRKILAFLRRCWNA